ncbi:MAG: DUF2236 domain-containing protein [Jatrophihabitantaceae bacterium]
MTVVSDSALAERVAAVTATAAISAYTVTKPVDEVDVEAWNYVGDPLCEALVTELRDRKMMGGGNLYAQARALQALGSGAADAFFADVEHVPEWAEFEAMRAGARMAKRNILGFLFAMHGSLAFTYVDPATAAVMNSTGRLSGANPDFTRRFWETATGFIGALDVDGMRPGGDKWEQWVRIRLLHTTIRLGIVRSGRWDLAAGMPISQIATGSGAHIFGRYRVNLTRALGGHATAEELDSFSLMWRWIARIEGTNAELLGADLDEQLALAQRISLHLYQPDHNSRELTSAMLDGLNQMRLFPLTRRLHGAVLRRVMAPDRLETFPDIDVPTGLGVVADPAADRIVALAVSASRIGHHVLRLPVLSTIAEAAGARVLDAALARGLHGRAATFRQTSVAGDSG